MTRMPLTIWAFFITAILGVLSFPVLLSCAVLLLMDRGFGTSFYLSDIVTSSGALDATGKSNLIRASFGSLVTLRYTLFFYQHWV